MAFWIVAITNFVLCGIIAYLAFQARDLRERVEDLEREKEALHDEVDEMEREVKKYREKPADLHFLDNALLPLWNALREHPPYDRLRDVYNLQESPDECCIKNVPVQDQLVIALRKASEEDLPVRLNELNELRETIENLFEDSIFHFYENMSIKEKTITQLEGDRAFSDFPFWKWYLREKIGVAPDIPDHVEEDNFKFQRFLDGLINYRRETGDQVTNKFLNECFERIVEEETEEEKKEQLQNIQEALDPIAESIEKFQSQLNDLKSEVERNIRNLLRTYDISNEEVEHDDLLTGFRQSNQVVSPKQVLHSGNSTSGDAPDAPSESDESKPSEPSRTDRSQESLGEFPE